MSLDFWHMSSGNCEKDSGLSHTPVMPAEVLQDLAPLKGGRYLDCTVGLGGHARNLLESVAETEICALDRDSEALSLAEERLRSHRERIHFFHLPFSRFEDALGNLGWSKINGCLLDLGVSSLQLDNAERGFSFRANGPLDMRMDRENNALSAKDIVNGESFEELKSLIAEYGEEPQAGRIAKAILKAREKNLIEDTAALAQIVAGAYPAAWRRTARNNPATRAFQAIRIKVNNELQELENFLQRILPWILPGGRIVIISFHSLEDRIVKNTFRNWSRGIAQKNMRGGISPGMGMVNILHKKPLVASPGERQNNPRSKSAKLRAAEKLPA